MASKEVFAVACIELYSRLWAQLESLLPVGRDPEAEVERVELLRLEIHLLINACEQARWRMLLTTPQRYALKATLQSAVLALDSDSEQGSGAQTGVEAIESAQNRLFDAVREYSMPLVGPPCIAPPLIGTPVLPARRVHG